MDPKAVDRVWTRNPEKGQLPKPAKPAKPVKPVKPLTAAERTHLERLQQLDEDLGLERVNGEGLTNLFSLDKDVLSYHETKALWIERVIRLEDFCNWEHDTDASVSWVSCCSWKVEQAC